jgi:hypothetical protein
MGFCTVLFATANGGRIDGKEQSEPHTDTQICSEAPGPRAIEVCGSEQPDLSKFPANTIQLLAYSSLRPSAIDHGAPGVAAIINERQIAGAQRAHGSAPTAILCQVAGHL